MDLSQPIWISGQDDIRVGAPAELALAKLANDRSYIIDGEITRVPRDRWIRAQVYEHDTWMKHALYAASDHNPEHAISFGNYEAAPDDLGVAVEVGCGPFTQLGTIIDHGKTIERAVLTDPLIEKYLKHPNCSYADSKLRGYSADIIDCRVEEMQFQDSCDTLVCINVLEHVADGLLALNNIKKVLKTGGTLIFHEHTWEKVNIANLYDAGHPIRLKASTIERFLDQFDMLYRAVNDSPSGNEYYVIATKR